MGRELLLDRIGQNEHRRGKTPLSSPIQKGFSELVEAGLIDRLPRMIIVQAANNSPLVTAFKQGKQKPIPFSDVHTIAKAIIHNVNQKLVFGYAGIPAFLSAKKLPSSQ